MLERRRRNNSTAARERRRVSTGLTFVRPKVHEVEEPPEIVEDGGCRKARQRSATVRRSVPSWKFFTSDALKSPLTRPGKVYSPSMSENTRTNDDWRAYHLPPRLTKDWMSAATRLSGSSCQPGPELDETAKVKHLVHDHEHEKQVQLAKLQEKQEQEHDANHSLGILDPVRRPGRVVVIEYDYGYLLDNCDTALHKFFPQEESNAICTGEVFYQRYAVGSETVALRLRMAVDETAVHLSESAPRNALQNTLNNKHMSDSFTTVHEDAPEKRLESFDGEPPITTSWEWMVGHLRATGPEDRQRVSRQVSRGIDLALEAETTDGSSGRDPAGLSPIHPLDENANKDHAAGIDSDGDLDLDKVVIAGPTKPPARHSFGTAWYTSPATWQSQYDRERQELRSEQEQRAKRRNKLSGPTPPLIILPPSLSKRHVTPKVHAYIKNFIPNAQVKTSTSHWDKL